MTAFGNELTRVLSIDFDVFFDLASFLPGSCNCYNKWVMDYNQYWDGFCHGMNFHSEDYQNLLNFLADLSQPVYVSESHEHVARILLENGVRGSVHLVNLDQHHDMWKFERKIDCGNWIHALNRMMNITVDWRRLPLTRPDDKSEQGICQGIPYVIFSEFGSVFKESYDYIFLIQSYDFSPSIYQHKFKALVDVCRNPVIDWEFPLVYTNYTEELEFAVQCNTATCLFDSIGEVSDEIADNDEIYKLCTSFEFMSKYGSHLNIDPDYLK